MAVTEDVIKLVLETSGQETIDRLTKSTANYMALLTELTKAYARGEVTTEEFLRTTQKYESAIQSEAAMLERLTAAQNAQAASIGKVDAAATKATKGMAGFGQSAMQAGRFIQDFQAAGVMGIANNLEGLALALGGGPGLAGALTLFGVAYLAFKPQIAEFVKSFSNAVDPVKAFQGTIETLEAKIKEISEKPHKFSIDIQQLENAKEQIDAIKRGLAALEAAKSGRTEDEKAAGDKFAKEFDATGGEGKAALEDVQRVAGDAAVASDPAVRAARKALADRERSQAAAQRAQKEAEDRATQAMTSGADIDTVAHLSNQADSARKEAEAFGDPEAMRNLRDNIKQASDEARKKSDAEIGNTMADVKKGNSPVARDVMADRFRAAGQDRFAKMVEASSPEGMAAQNAAKQAADLDAHNAEQTRAGLAAREKERLKEAEAAGRAAEQDPEAKAEQERIDRIFGGFGREGVDANQAAKNAAAARQRANAKGQRADDAPTANAMAQAMNDIANVAAGVVNNQALAANKMVQAAARLRQVSEQAARVRRQIEMPGNWNGNPMGGD